MNRFDRLASILIHLQSKRIVVAQDIADRFTISLRTVYRDIRSLEEAGVPVIGEKGLGYSIMEGYRLPPVMFTEEEVLAFLMAEKVLENHADLHNSRLFKSAMFKIRAVLRNAEKAKLEQMEENIAVRQKNSEVNTLINDTLPVLMKAISEKRVLYIQYNGDGGNADDEAAHIAGGRITEKHIEPIGIFHEHGGWNTLAYCQEQKTIRHFRTERIHAIKLTGRAFSNVHPTMNEYFDRTTPKQKTFPVVIDVNAHMARYLQEQKYNHGFKHERLQKDVVQMHFDAPCLEAFSRWYVTFADVATIVQPVELKGLLKQRLAEVLKKIS